MAAAPDSASVAHRNAHVMGLPEAESDALLDELWDFCVQPQFCLRHQWQVGQVLCWDNRQVVHCRQAFDPSKVRTMWRTQVKGERPRAPGSA